MADTPRTRARRRVVVVDNRPLAQSIGQRIRAARERAGLTQRELAAGRYTGAYISALEKGIAKPSMAALSFLAERLAVPVREFLGDETPTRTRLEAEIRLASGDCEQALTIYRGLMARPADRRVRAELLRGTAEALYRLDQPTEAIGAAAEAVSLFRELRRDADAAAAGYWLACAQQAAENFAEARSLLQAILGRLQDGLTMSPDFTVRVLVGLADAEMQDGDRARALAHLEEARSRAEGLNDRRRAEDLFSTSKNLEQGGDVEGSLRVGVQALALFRAAQADRELVELDSSLAITMLGLGELDRARTQIAQARRTAERLGDRAVLAHISDAEAQISLAEGDHEEAATHAQAAVDLAESASDERVLAAALLTRARSQRAGSRDDLASESYAAAAEVMRRGGPRRPLREALSEWAELLSRGGDHRRANELYREALSARPQ